MRTPAPAGYERPEDHHSGEPITWLVCKRCGAAILQVHGEDYTRWHDGFHQVEVRRRRDPGELP